MTREPAGLEDLILHYEDALTRGAYLRNKASLAEVDRAKWVNEQIGLLVASGLARTRADSEAHADLLHRDMQAKIAEYVLQADLADRDARVLAFRIRAALATMEGRSLTPEDK